MEYKDIEYKEYYTKEEVQELVDWFKGRELPQSMQINESEKTDNLELTLDILCSNALEQCEKPVFNNNIRNLLRIKRNLEEAE